MSSNEKCQHRCECDHEQVRVCSKCKVVHCLDCKMEWVEKVTWAYGYGGYPNYYPYQWINCQGSAVGSDGVGTLTAKAYPTQDNMLPAGYTHFNPAGESISPTCLHERS